MKKQTKRLLLNKENVRVLTGNKLHGVAGAGIAPPITDTGADDDSRIYTCTDSASKAPTGACVWSDLSCLA